MRFTLVASATALLLASTAVSAQDRSSPPPPNSSMGAMGSTPETGSTMPTDALPTAPAPPMNPPVGEQPMPDQQSMGQGGAAPGVIAQPSMGAMDKTLPPAPKADYPMCSKTVTDGCKQAEGGYSMKSKKHKR